MPKKKNPSVTLNLVSDETKVELFGLNQHIKALFGTKPIQSNSEARWGWHYASWLFLFSCNRGSSSSMGK